METARQFSRTTPAGTELLRGRLDGALVTPADRGWDAARQAWNLAADQRPAAVVLAESAADGLFVANHTVARSR